MGDNGLINLPPAAAESLNQGQGQDLGGEGQDSPEDLKLSPVERMKKKQSDYNKRFSEMTSRNDRLLAAIEESNRRFDSVQEELRALKEGTSRRQEESSRPKSQLEGYDVESLERAELDFSNPQSERFNVERAYEIRKELRRRDREEIQREFDSRISRERQSRELKDQGDYAVLQAAQLLGESGNNYVDFSSRTIKDTQESRVAGTLFQNLKKDLEKRGVDANLLPELKAYSILLADRFISAQREARAKSETRNKEAELNRARTAGQLSAQSEAAAETESRVKAAIESGNIDAVLGELPQIKKYEERTKRR